MIKRFFLVAIMLAFAGLVQAQTYPSKPIRMIVPFPPGGGVDTAARIISQPLSERLGQPIVIDNRPGAAGNIGTALAAREKPDGYTLLMGSLSPNSVNPHLYSRLDFDPIKDFAPIAIVYSVPSFLVVPASSPVNTAQELVALAKANPGKLNFGSGGVGGAQHLYGVVFNKATNIDAVHIAYKGASPAETALIAGQLDYMLDQTACIPLIKAGRLKALAIGSPSRNPTLPNVPTLDELGIPGVHTDTWYGVMAPANTPKEIVNRLNKEINEILQTPEMRERIVTKFAARPGSGTPKDFTQFLNSEIERYGVIVKLSGAKKVD